MPAKKTDIIHAKGIDIGVYTTDYSNDYVSLTDIARFRSIKPTITIHNWLRNRDVVEFLGLWETLHNPEFKVIEFDNFKLDAGSNAYVFSISEWVKSLNGIGLVSKSGRNGGIYAHMDIALEFASWVSPEFKLYIIKDYKRLKQDENSQLSLSWNLNREIAKLNYKIHTDAIRDNLLPPELTSAQMSMTYASEADVLNVAVFGKTAKDWRLENPKKKGNLRDNATLQQLLVLANMESYNAIMIEENFPQGMRLEKLREATITQLKAIQHLNTEHLPVLPESIGDEKD